MNNYKPARLVELVISIAYLPIFVSRELSFRLPGLGLF